MKLSKIVLSTLLCVSLVGCSSSSDKTSTSTSKPKSDKVTLPDYKTTVIENDLFKFDITGADDDFLSYEWNTSVQNKSDQNLTFSIEYMNVDHIMSSGFMYHNEVTPGNTGNEAMQWMKSSIEEEGVTSFSKVTFTLDVYNSDTYDSVFKQEFTLYPNGEDKQVDARKDASEGDTVLLDNDYAKMFVKSVDPDDTFGYAIKVAILNKTSDFITVSIENASIDGIMADPFWATIIAPDTQDYSEISWSSTTLEEAGIKDPASFSLPIRIYSLTSLDTFSEDTVTFTPTK